MVMSVFDGPTPEKIFATYNLLDIPQGQNVVFGGEDSASHLVISHPDNLVNVVDLEVFGHPFGLSSRHAHVLPEMRAYQIYSPNNDIFPASMLAGSPENPDSMIDATKVERRDARFLLLNVLHIQRQEAHFQRVRENLAKEIR